MTKPLTNQFHIFQMKTIPNKYLVVHIQQWKHLEKGCEICSKLTIKTAERRH